MKLLLEEIASWVGGRVLHSDGKIEVRGVSTDSRMVRKGEIFIALEGPNFDGHDFVGDAMREGAVAAIVHREDALGHHPGILVSDTLQALGDFAHRYRWHGHLIPWVAVTGSNGKTSTRRMITTILETRGVVCAPTDNFNNLVGLPLTILRCPSDAWVGVLEMGTSRRGEIARLTAIATPTIGVVTCVGHAHLDGLGSLEGVAQEKAAIFSRLPRDGVAIYPAKDPYVGILTSTIHGNRASFALESGADMVAEDVQVSLEGTRFRVRGVDFFIPLLGAHNAANCLAALLVAEHLKIGLKECAEALRNMQPVKDRLQCIHAGPITILDDVYNANPDSLRTAVDFLVSIPAERRVVIIGDMLELGRDSMALHRKAGKWLNRKGIDVICAVGKETLPLAESAAFASARTIVRHFRSVQALDNYLPSLIRPGDLILVKGSRGMKMERVVKTLQSLSFENKK